MRRFFLALIVATAALSQSACIENNVAAPSDVQEEVGVPNYLVSPTSVQWLGLQVGSSYVMAPVTFYAPAGTMPTVAVKSSIPGISPSAVTNCERAADPSELRQVCQVQVIVYAYDVADGFVTIEASAYPRGSAKFRVSIYPFGGKGNLGVGAYIPST